MATNNQSSGAGGTDYAGWPELSSMVKVLSPGDLNGLNLSVLANQKTVLYLDSDQSEAPINDTGDH